MEKKKGKRRRETTPHSTPMGFKYKIDAYIGVSITAGRSDGGCRAQSDRQTDRPTVLEPAQSEKAHELAFTDTDTTRTRLQRNT